METKQSLKDKQKIMDRVTCIALALAGILYVGLCGVIYMGFKSDRSNLELVRKLNDKTPRYEEGINVNQSLNDQLYDGIGKGIYEKNGLKKQIINVLFPGYEKRYIEKYIKNQENESF
ncbi:MAG: hypothetical protein IB618_04240 [Candidatus Pacearchaeota archaeon]|nr:MAG: hypothetical protein IB618_04240 [Candidatus Pacearchaeota archaeon]